MAAVVVVLLLLIVVVVVVIVVVLLLLRSVMISRDRCVFMIIMLFRRSGKFNVKSSNSTVHFVKGSDAARGTMVCVHSRWLLCATCAFCKIIRFMW